MGKQVPIVDYLVLDDGAPHLVANESRRMSGALYFDRRNADAKCGGRAFRTAAARRRRGGAHASRSCTGRRRASRRRTCRSIVDLDGGGVVKANLAERRARPRRRALRDATSGSTTYVAGVDDDGTEAIAFAYEPA